MGAVKTWDAIVVGAGIIGLALAIELRKQGRRVLLVDKGEPGREASWAAGGMLVASAIETPAALQPLAEASARMYPEFVHELQDESGLKIDLRSVGTLLWRTETTADKQSHTLPALLNTLEPEVTAAGVPLFLHEQCVDPRTLLAAAVAAARHRGVDFSSGDEVVTIQAGRAPSVVVRTTKTQFSSGVVVNCAGAWSGKISPHALPVRPVKGQMLSVVMPHREYLRHVMRTPDVYLIPRSDGRLVIGATVEEAGFNKQTVPETIQKLRRAALQLAPGLRDARILEAWAGLRPGTPDALPILGPTPTPGYFAATGHYRDGILLAPATARTIADLVAGTSPAIDLGPFSPARFSWRAST